MTIQRESLGGLTRRTRKGQARKLRASPTKAESRFWLLVRSGRVEGLGFRRQHQIGPWIVDFYCHELRLIVEVVGSIHDSPAMRQRDAERTKDLESKGFKLVEFLNEEVLSTPHMVEEKLHSLISNIASPSPLGEGGAHRRSPIRGDGRVGVKDE